MRPACAASSAVVLALPSRRRKLFALDWVGRNCSGTSGTNFTSSTQPESNPLLTLDNTVVTSHLAGASLDNFSGMFARAVANAEAVLRGDALPSADVAVAPAALQERAHG